ncbi:hypothetical protein C2G38_2028273 [Gigaspora rosea]|uniref:Uncharacterized protein n=1 Tax=Gigaspora rosea TaxID=44941 RepID=A0A397W3W3_9GLOM|nr:hypothetical protein C2G38_2028273 [Gigaspora rosea]
MDGKKKKSIDDEVFYEKENCKIEKETYRSIKDILNYTIPAWLENGGLSIQDPVLRIRLSGDGRNVGRKIKHVMVTFTLLNNLLNHYEPDYHYTLILYPGIESYESLKLATKLLIKDLNDIKTGFIDYQGRKWNVELYFSADWKFMAMCLGHKAANCDAFCLWCNCKKNTIGYINPENGDWCISKNIEKIANNYATTPGYNN